MVAMEILRGDYFMSNINVYKDISVDIELSDEEKDNLTLACKILHNISKQLWTEDAEDTETFTRVYDAKESLRYFLRCDIGIELDNKGEIVNVD